LLKDLTKSLVERALEGEMTALFDFPPAIRKVTYTTNAIESLNYSPRKVLKNRGAFPHDESIQKILYLALQNASKKWKSIAAVCIDTSPGSAYGSATI